MTGDAPTRKPLAEIIVGLVSAMAVAVLVLFLVFRVVTGDDSPPDLVAHVQSAQPVAAKTRVMVMVTNRGEQTAAGVTVRAEILGDAGREISFDYVAAGSSQRGAFLFDRPDVAADEVSLTIYGFAEP
ncbi:MAG: hypothetical protein ACK4YU_01045 [Paracoccus sp. (in: a-proteobacteria)]